jgi:hypothetical protein
MFLWSGTKLFPFVAVYDPEDGDGTVRAIHFSTDEQTLEESCMDFLVQDRHQCRLLGKEVPYVPDA